MSELQQSQQESPTLGEAGEPCGRCGAALAADQRYCLNCGTRRGEPRVDFRRHLKSDATPAPEPAAAPAAPAGGPPLAGSGEKRQRDYAPLAAAGGIAVLGVMLLIGVLIGRGTGSTSGSSAPPQVVTVGEASGTAAGGDPKGGEGGGAANAGSNGAKKKNAAAKSSSSGKVDTGSAPVVSDEALQGLEEQSGESYSDASAKLPDEIATGGAPPPEDNKAPGGGSGAQTIE